MRALLLLGLAGALAVLLLWLASRDGRASVGRAEPLRATAASGAQPLTAGAATERDLERDARAIVRAPLAPTKKGPLGDRMLVCVRDRASGKPVPEALILCDSYRFKDLTPDEQRLHDRNAQQGELELNLLRFGIRYTTDAKGEALLPRIRAGARVEVSGEFYAQRFLGEDEPSPATVWAERDLTLRLQAVDGDGNPVAGVGFALGWENEQSSGVLAVRFRPTADPSIVAASHFHARWSEFQRTRELHERPEIVAGAPLLARARYPLDEQSWSARVQRVTLPPHGSVVVQIDPRLVHGDRRPTVFVGVCGERGSVNGLHELFDASTGRATFAAVGLNQRLSVSVSHVELGAHQRQRFEPHGLELAGPTQAGQIVLVDLR